MDISELLSISPEDKQAAFYHYEKLRYKTSKLNPLLKSAKEYLENICQDDITELPNGLLLIRETIPRVDWQIPQEIKEKYGVKVDSSYFTWKTSSITEEEIKNLLG